MTLRSDTRSLVSWRYCTRLVNLTMGASLPATVLESEWCIGRPQKPLLWWKHLVSICYRSRVIADSNLDGRLLLADDVRQAAEAAVVARSRSRALLLDVVFKPKPREVSACCYGRPNYAMTTSYQWTAFNVYLVQNWNPDISGLERARLIL